MNTEDLLHQASEDGLQIVETCDNSRGYPSGIKKAIIGFETYKDGADFIADNMSGNVYMSLLKIRDGHHFYQDQGWKYESFTCYDQIADMGDDWNEDTPQELFEARMQDIDSESSSYFEDVKNLVDNCEPLFDAYEDMDQETEVMVTNGFEYEIILKTMMSYSEDVYRYIIGIVIE